MDLCDKVVRRTASAPQPDDRFTAEEAQRLTALQPVYRDVELDERRLQCARWLVEHGRLSDEFLQGADREGAPPAEPITDRVRKEVARET